MTNAPGRISIPPEAWEQQEMRWALAAREISTVYRLLRRIGVTERQMAAMTGQSLSEVVEILKGRQVMAFDVLARIADGLGVPRGYMGLAYDEVTAVRVAGATEASTMEEDERRRKFLAAAAAVLLGEDEPVADPPPPRPTSKAALRVVDLVLRLLPQAGRQRYGEEYLSDLSEIAQQRHPIRAQLAYTLRVLLHVPSLRSALRTPEPQSRQQSW